MIVYGIDPGLNTGIARFDGAELTGSWTTFMGVDGFVDWWIESPPGLSDIIVIENYISDGTVNSQVWSSEVIGAVRALHRGKMIRQLRSEKAGLIKGAESKRNEWLNERFPGLSNQHTKDAATHALKFLKDQRNAEVLRRYWL